jgi:hypothetical protein
MSLRNFAVIFFLQLHVGLSEPFYTAMSLLHIEMSNDHPDQYRAEGDGTMHERDVIDRSSGNGASEGDRDEQDGAVEYDDTAVGQTTFDPAEADDSDRFEELLDRHHERYSHHPSSRRGRDHVYDARTVASQLEFTDYQTQELIRRVKKADLEEGSYGYEEAILAIATLVANEDGRWIRRDDGDVGDPLASTFDDIRIRFGVRRSAIRQLRKRLQ